MTSRPKILLMAAALALSACSTTPTATVLSFHQQPPARGTITIQPADAQQAGSLEFGAQADAVRRELVRAGYAVVPGTQAQFRAVVTLQTTERMSPGRSSGVSIGLGGGFSSGHVGMGTSVSVPVGGKPRPGVATTTTLSVAIVETRGSAIWEGRSSLETEASGQQGTALAPILAETLFKDFPGTSGKTVQVPIR